MDLTILSFLGLHVGDLLDELLDFTYEDSLSYFKALLNNIIDI
ncbi:hypothetical protein [Bacillus sp. AFS073361]|nr:hypothetical protein [Bacillus sp. AFS073361]